MSVPPTGRLRKHTIVDAMHVWHQGLLETHEEWAPRFFTGKLEYLLEESLMTGIPLPGMNPI